MSNLRRVGFAWMLLALGCVPASTPSAPPPAAPPPAVLAAPGPVWAEIAARAAMPRHAAGYRVTALAPNVVRVDLLRRWRGSSEPQSWTLVRGEAPASQLGPTATVPQRRVAALSSTYLPWFAALDAWDNLAGIGAARDVVADEVHARLQRGTVQELGQGPSLRREALLALRPDAVWAFALAPEQLRPLDVAGTAGASVLAFGEYLEETPLGRAEWIKVAGLLLDKPEAAARAFDGIEQRYNKLAALGKAAKTRPKVLLNAPFRGVWWLPGGRSNLARLLADAGADYPWADLDTSESRTIDFEAVLLRARDAEVWLHPGQWRRLADGTAEDERFALFAPFRTGAVWNNDARRNPHGAIDFYETGLARPDELLADLLAVLHPELLPGHALRYYRRLPP